MAVDVPSRLSGGRESFKVTPGQVGLYAATSGSPLHGSQTSAHGDVGRGPDLFVVAGAVVKRPRKKDLRHVACRH